MFVCICIYIYAHTYKHIYIHIYICIRIRIYMCLYSCIYTYIYVYICICMYTCVWICITVWHHQLKCLISQCVLTVWATYSIYVCCVCVCMSVCLCVCVCVYMCVGSSVNVKVFPTTCMCVSLCVCASLRVSVDTCMCVCFLWHACVLCSYVYVCSRDRESKRESVYMCMSVCCLPTRGVERAYNMRWAQHSVRFVCFIYSETQIIARDSHAIFSNSVYSQRLPLKSTEIWR